jgi:hypothetical protein
VYLVAGSMENRVNRKRMHRTGSHTGDGEWGHKGAESGCRVRVQSQGAEPGCSDKGR